MYNKINKINTTTHKKGVCNVSKPNHYRYKTSACIVMPDESFFKNKNKNLKYFLKYYLI